METQVSYEVVPTDGVHLQQFTQVLSAPGETFAARTLALCPACAARMPGLTKWSGEVIGAYCDGCGAGPSVPSYQVVDAEQPPKQPPAPPRYEKTIRYDPETGDYRLELDGELVGFARSYHDGEVMLDTLVLALLRGQGRA